MALLLLSAAAASSAAELLRAHDAASLEAALELVAPAGADRRGRHQVPAVLLLREGLYELSRTLELPGNTTLRAEPGHEVTLRLGAALPHPVLSVRDASGVTVSGIRIVGHDSSEPLQRSTALEVEGGSDVTLERLTVTGGVWVSGGERHVLSRSVVSNEFGAAHGNCVYLTNAGDGTSLSPCGHTISHTEIHDCRGLGDPWPSSKSPCDPAHQKREHKPPCNPDPFPNITGNGILINQVVGANVTNNFIHDGSIHIFC